MIPVTRPMLPPLEEFNKYLTVIWESRWLTNNGQFHQELEQKLCEYLGVKYISLFSNGTLALITALQALRVTGEVITTPYSFVATTHSLWWNNIKPVFVDIEPEFCNLDPEKIEAAITPSTTAIMPVHVYGNPCNIELIQNIASTYGLRVIYDAAHAFGTKYKEGGSVLNYGDMSILSFHATKAYTTIEGGAIVCHDPEIKQRVDKLKNFGFANETTVVAPGINAKMNEVQAAFGLLQLKYIDAAINKREEIDNLYRLYLDNVKGIRLLKKLKGATTPHSYFPIFVDPKSYGRSRDGLYELLKKNDIYGRRYFFPLISDFPTYRGLPSADAANLPVATRIAKEVICLPIYHDLSEAVVEKVCNLIKINK